MALLQGDIYLKISDISIDYLNKKATVTIRSYKSKKLRDTEKEILPKIKSFLFKMSQALASLEQQLTEQQVAAKLTKYNAQQVFSSNPQLKEATDKYYALRKDSNLIRRRLGTETIEKRCLQFLSFWESLGLTDELRTTTIRSSVFGFSIPIPDTTDLSSVYVAVKESIPDSVDC